MIDSIANNLHNHNS